MARQGTRTPSQQSSRANRKRGTGQRSQRASRSVLASDLGAGAATATATQARPAATPRRQRARNLVHPLSREQEYAFIHADLRRLLITAAIVAAVMVVMLFVLD